ncbi:hypothetical protein Hanom_Chr07g00590451 [Helianthus anomalus]
MELTSQMKMARFQTFWIQMRKNKPLDRSPKTDQTSGTKIAFYSKVYSKYNYVSEMSYSLTGMHPDEASPWCE